MSLPVRPNHAAEDEFRHYIKWYERETVGLGDRLWLEIQAAIDLVGAHPSIGELVPRVRARGPVRRLPLRHFPFLLVYRVQTDHIDIVAWAHTSRKPNYWRSR